MNVVDVPGRGYELRVTAPDLKDGHVCAPYLLRVISADGIVSVPIDHATSGRSGLQLAGSKGDLSAEAAWTRPRSAAGYFDVELKVRYGGESPADLGLQVSFDLAGSGRPTWMIPGAFYKENRPEGCARIYPRYSYGGGALDQLVSDSWSFRADRTALPAVFAWNDSLCAALCTDHRSPLGLSGVGFRGNAGGTSIWLNFPYREEPVTYHGSSDAWPADCATHRWSPGEQQSVQFRLYLAPPDTHAYDPFIRAMYDIHKGENELRAWMGIERGAELAAHGLYHWHYHPEHHALYETATFDRDAGDPVGIRGDRPHMHVGWVSGTPYAHALLMYGRREGNEHYVDAAVRVLDKIAGGIAPCGAFWAEWTLERGWGTGWNPRREWLQARTLAEATLFMVRALSLEREQGQIHPDWESAALSNLRFAVASQRDDGNYGSYYHFERGDVEEWDGAAGIVWIAALLEGAAYFEEPGFTESAFRAGRYYRRFVDDDYIYGAPEDVHLAPTSEDAYNAVLAYVLLYEAERSSEWLDLARRAADWMMTFRWTYNLDFPERTILARYDFRSRGGDHASPSNQHLGSYGLICLPEMLRLWRYTGDRYYLDRTRDNLACFLQFVAREDGDFNAYKGMVSERFYNTNCFRPKGMLLELSHAWCVGLVLYACQEAAPYRDDLDLPVADGGRAC